MASPEVPPPRKGWELEGNDGKDTDPLERTDAVRKRTHCSVREAFSFATTWELILFLVGNIAAMGHGFSQPAMCVLFGELIDAVAEDDDIIQPLNEACWKMVLLGCAAMVCASVQLACFQYFSRKQAARFRVLYVQSVLHQDISWFDNRQVESLPTQMSLDAEKILDAFGDKLGSTCMSWWAFIGGVLCAFILSWHIALACLIMVPLCAIAANWMATFLQQIQGETQGWYANAAAVVEECLYAFRTVVAFGGEKRELATFGSAVEQARRGGVRGGFKMAVAFACNMSVMYLSYALAFYAGALLVYDGVEHPTRGRAYTSGDVLATTFCVFVGGFFLGSMPPGFVAFMEGRRAMCNLLDAQKTPTTIESRLEEDGRTPCPDIESMELKEVRFSYPSRPEVPVLAGLNLHISKGQKVAIVGESGSGKSTVMSLLERFYDPDIGAVLINGKDMKTFAVKSVRRRIGYVGQEPVLFAASIKENILQGSGNLQNLENELNLVVAEAELGFVNELPQGLNTYVGSGGSQFSGGQKQRIAIARALIKKTSVLFFDEATSALDNKSERMIQHTIDQISSKAAGSLTTVSIAHRLTTIQHSDVIHVLAKGIEVESGTHLELLHKKGTYYALAAAQKVTEDKQVGEAQEMKPAAETQQAGEVSSIAQTSLLSKSKSLDEEAKEKDRTKKVAKEYKVPLRRVMSFCRPELPWLLPGILGALVDGSCMPLSVVFLVRAMDSLGDADKEDMRDTMETLCLILAGIAVVDFFALVISHLSFAILGEALTMRLRVALLTQMFRQEVGFHDDPENTPARLGQALELWAYRISTLVKAWGAKAGVSSAVIIGLVIAFYFSWEIASAMVLSIPITIATMVLQMIVALGASKTTVNGMQRAEQISADAVQNARVCHACVNEDEIVTLFKSLLKTANEGMARKVTLMGLAFGFSVGTIFWILAAGFYLAGVIVDKGDRDFVDVITAFLGIFFSAMGAGQCASTMGDATKAKVAAHDMFKLLDRKSEIDSWDPKGQTPVLENHMEAGVISFEAVRFRYPFRPDVEVLKGMSFSVQQGQAAGLVGPSGGGKSTVMAMIQRFYDPDAGNVYISLQRQALASLNIVWWRRQLGFVGQEPILFNTTVKANIIYGLSDDESVSDDWLEKCAKMANLAFLDEQPKRLETDVGPKGSRLSGGQKQRVAICRALFRNPPVLLFDEATSALDTQSEKIVQQALETVREGRTSFSIAHRLSTISECHVILVVSSGIIVEEGTHAELMGTGGVYSKLVEAANQHSLER